MKTHLLTLAAAILAVAAMAPATANALGVGDEVPDLRVEQWYNTTEEYELEDLRGKVIVLEFFGYT